MEESTILVILFALVVLKLILPQPAIEQGQKIGFVQFRCDGRPYFAKVIGDGYVLASVFLPILLVSMRPLLGDAIQKSLSAVLVLCPVGAPAVYLLMKPGTDRTIRFCASAVLAAAWLLINMPAI